MVMIFNTTFNNISVISWRAALLMEKTGVLGENHRHPAITNKIHVQRDTIKTLILRVVLRVPLVEQKLFTYPEPLSSLLMLVGTQVLWMGRQFLLY
jgi:hypothetical protein